MSLFSLGIMMRKTILNDTLILEQLSMKTCASLLRKQG